MRYLVKGSWYIWADDNSKALIEAATWAKKQCMEKDNQAQIEEVSMQPFASLSMKKIHEGKLTLLDDNEILEVVK